jgi:pyridoxamine 5'-phosphate oxidase
MAMDTRQLIDRFRESLKRAADAGLNLSNGCALATVGEDGAPAARVVLLKEVDERGFVFYTNLTSRKARELSSNPRAALCFWWPQLEEQIRVEGEVVSIDDGEADLYWDTRPRDSQLGAISSRQSEPLSSYDDLLEQFEATKKKYDRKTIPRPSYWSGYRLVPQRIEFWTGRQDRLHLRELFRRRGQVWHSQLLNP